MPIVEQGGLKHLSSRNIQAVPEAMGVYHLINNRHAVIFIGQSNNLRRRLEEHLEAKSYHAQYFRWFRTRTEIEADHLESVHIDKHRPIHNASKWRNVKQEA